MGVKVHYKELVVGAILSTAIFLPWAKLLEARPYTNVEVVSVETDSDSITIAANFRKNECTFQRLEVFGTDLGLTYHLPWTNTPVPEEDDYGTSYDRTAGDHTLRLHIETGGKVYDSIEIRTRHLCGDEVVDKVFATIKV